MSDLDQQQTNPEESSAKYRISVLQDYLILTNKHVLKFFDLSPKSRGAIDRLVSNGTIPAPTSFNGENAWYRDDFIDYLHRKFKRANKGRI